MLRGMYTSAQGMMAQMQTLEVVSNNIANANTTGFRGASAVQQSFPEMLLQSIEAIPGQAPHSMNPIGGTGWGTLVVDHSVNFASGAMQQTGGTFDVAIGGTGFFAIEQANGEEMFTRNGAFTLDANRILVTGSGDRVMSTSGNAITIPDEGEVLISSTGEIRIDGNLIDTLRVVDFETPSELRQFGYNLFRAPASAGEIEFAGTLSQGYLEGSNVSVVNEMVRMINVSRSFEMNQRMITIQDGTLDRAVNEIARR